MTGHSIPDRPSRLIDPANGTVEPAGLYHVGQGRSLIGAEAPARQGRPGPGSGQGMRLDASGGLRPPTHAAARSVAEEMIAAASGTTSSEGSP